MNNYDPFGLGFQDLPALNFQQMQNLGNEANLSNPLAAQFQPKMTPANPDGGMSFMPQHGAMQMSAQGQATPLHNWVNQGGGGMGGGGVAQGNYQAQPDAIPQERYQQMQAGVAPTSGYSQAPQGMQEPAQTGMANPYMQAMLYQQAQQNGDYDTMNSIRAAQGLQPIEHNWFTQFKNIVTGAPDQSLGTMGQVAQFGIPILMDLIKSINTNKFLDQNQSMVNNAMAGNISAAKSAMGVK